PRLPFPSCRRTLLRRDDELPAAVAGPALLRLFRAERSLLTVAHGVDARGIDAEAHQVVAHRRGAPLAEREVVLARTARVGVTFDVDPRRRPPLQPLRVLLEDRAGLFGVIRTIELEVHARQRLLRV